MRKLIIICVVLVCLFPMNSFSFDWSGTIYDQKTFKCQMRADSESLLGLVMHHVPEPIYSWHRVEEYLAPGIINRNHSLIKGLSAQADSSFHCYKAMTNGAFILSVSYPVLDAYSYGRVMSF